ncbi:branched-chain amino acid ABC transporter permease [Ornithinimicrobium flavum]|uniref:branched-chain amino acid ABC transporter permease n=1 Tax=Ornithinimicrobium flavum TaxID=1288636 RepID=UPI0013054803|nr:branched-chain amino acid ABC transporter permease [Ornithinimicrobium flavum]
MSGHYLALATIAFGLTLGFVARQVSITGGASGIFGVPDLAIGTMAFRDDLSFYYLAAAILFVAVVLVRNMLGSMFGRSLLALGDSEIAASSSGISTARHKRTAFVVAAVLAALAGSLQAHWIAFVDYHTLDLLLSIQILIMATVGGVGTVWGAAVGSFIVIALSHAAKETASCLPQRRRPVRDHRVWRGARRRAALHAKGVAGTVADALPGRRKEQAL